MHLLILTDECHGIPAYDETRKLSDCHVTCSNANKGWFKRGCIASREPEASRSGIHNPRNLHHTNKQIFKLKPEYFRECICTRLNKWVPKDVYILIPQICYVILTWQNGLCTHDYVKILEIQISLASLGGPNVITRVFTRGIQEGQSHKRYKDLIKQDWCSMREGSQIKERRQPL